MERVRINRTKLLSKAMLDYALEYAEKDIPIFPLWPRDGDGCGCGDENCKHPGKHPIADYASNGMKDATTEPKKINEWWGRRMKSAGIGAPTGKASGFIIIDCDVDEGTGKSGFEALAKLEEKLGELPKTRAVQTPRGGFHFYFKYAEGIACSQDKKNLIDIRGEGGSIVLPPSHGRYNWIEEGELPDLPQAWHEYLSQKKSDTPYFLAAAAAKIEMLAELDGLEYDLQRKIIAKEMGVRPSTIDKEVEKRRESSREVPSFLAPVEPWDEPVDGGELVDELCDTIERHMVLPRRAADAIALWILHAHAHDATRISPILTITSPTKRCGKTTLISYLTAIVPKALTSANVTPATIFRAIERWRPTLLIDEADTFIRDKSELRGVINSGHNKAAAYVLRCVGDDLIPQPFSTWAPKAIALIGRMPDTLEDRSIKIELQRKLATDSIRPLPTKPDAFVELQRKCARWAEDNMEKLRQAKPKVPKKLNDRARDNWRPLLAIAELCGPDYYDCARRAALRLSGNDEDDAHAVLLLQDLKAIFERENHKNISSAAIVHDLIAMEDRPWPEFKNGAPLTTRGLAKLLKPFKIEPKQVRTRGGQQQGYRHAQFENAFARYLSSSPDESPDKSDKKRTPLKGNKKSKRKSKKSTLTESGVSEDSNERRHSARP